MKIMPKWGWITLAIAGLLVASFTCYISWHHACVEVFSEEEATTSAKVYTKKILRALDKKPELKEMLSKPTDIYRDTAFGSVFKRLMNERDPDRGLPIKFNKVNACIESGKLYLVFFLSIEIEGPAYDEARNEYFVRGAIAEIGRGNRGNLTVMDETALGVDYQTFHESDAATTIELLKSTK